MWRSMDWVAAAVKRCLSMMLWCDGSDSLPFLDPHDDFDLLTYRRHLARGRLSALGQALCMERAVATADPGFEAPLGLDPFQSRRTGFSFAMWSSVGQATGYSVHWWRPADFSSCRQRR